MVKKKNYKLIALILAVLFFAMASFVLGIIFYFNTINFEGKEYFLKNRYSLTVWFDDNEEINEVRIKDMKKDILISKLIFWPSGIQRGFQRRIEDGYIFVAYTEQGKISFIDTQRDGSDTYKRERFSDKGALVEVEELVGSLKDK